MQRPTNDLRPERFQELVARAQRIGRRCWLMFFGGLGAVYLAVYLLKGHLPERHWLWAGLNLGVLGFLAGLMAYAFWSQRQLALRLNVVCGKCGHVPLPHKFRRLAQARACPKCGQRYEVRAGTV